MVVNLEVRCVGEMLPPVGSLELFRNQDLSAGIIISTDVPSNGISGTAVCITSTTSHSFLDRFLAAESEEFPIGKIEGEQLSSRIIRERR